MSAEPLDERIKAAFLEGAQSAQVAPLIAEAEAAAISAGEATQRARDKALDPTLSAREVAAARREMEDAAFCRDRMQRAAIRLTERVAELQRREENQRRIVAYDNAKAERDALAAELRKLYPAVAPRLCDLLAWIVSNDRELQRINTGALPDAAMPLLGAEATARGLPGYVDGAADIPRITAALRLPAFEYNSMRPYSWPLR